MNDEIDIQDQKIERIRERVLAAEKERLHMKLPRNILNDIQDIIEEEVE